VNESVLVNMQQWVQLGQLCQAGGGGCVNVSNTGFTAVASWLSESCTVDSTHKANQVIVFTPNGNNQVIPANGGYWDAGLDLGVGRNNPHMDDNWADDYSKTSACPASLADDSHFALYYNGTLLREWDNSTTYDDQTGAAPCCGGGFGPSLVRVDGEREFTFTPTYTPVPTGLLASAVAVPNVSRNGEPIQFKVELNKPSKISLAIYTLLGEPVYFAQVEGGQGSNTLVWDARNNAGRAVASGLYLYVIQTNDGQTQETRKGKVAVIH
jgi:hypothetical protein